MLACFLARAILTSTGASGGAFLVQLLLQPGIGVGQIGGVAAIDSGDQTSFRDAALLVHKKVGQRRDQPASHALQGVGPLGNDKRFLDDQRCRHVAADFFPARIVGGEGRQRTGRTQSLVLIVLRILQKFPQALREVLPVVRQRLSNHDDFLRLPLEQPTVQVLHLPGVHRQQGEAGVELLARVVFLLGQGIAFVQEGIEPAAIGSHVFDNAWHIGGAGFQQTISQGVGRQSAITFPTDKAQHNQTGSRYQPPHRMVTGRPAHHLPLRRRPVLRCRQPADTEPLRQRRQLSVLRAGVPDDGPIRQQQFGPAPASLLLLAGQPGPQRRHQVVVGELVVFFARFHGRG
jgi:hypothetical protein